MVKGTNKHVIVVRSPEPKMFEEAIFIVRDDYARSAGSDRQIMEQARKTAAEYARNSAGKRPGRKERLKAFLLAVSGAVIAGGMWFALQFFGS